MSHACERPRSGDVGKRLAVVAVVATVCCSCSSLSPDQDSAVRVARTAHTLEDPERACRELAEDVVSELEQSAGKPCGEALPDEVSSSGGAVRSAHAEGQTAQVVFEDDVVFLALFKGEWKVTAMACTPRDDRPYDCAVKGG